ncbi:MAG: hypothetical protein GY769_07960 [bacterium]|nr:hypothetical protein [bacterium]
MARVRRKGYIFTGPLLSRWLTEDKGREWRHPYRIVRGLPKGAKFVQALPAAGGLMAVFEHESFASFDEEKEAIPLDDIQIQTPGWQMTWILDWLYKNREEPYGDDAARYWDKLASLFELEEEEEPESDGL